MQADRAEQSQIGQVDVVVVITELEHCDRGDGRFDGIDRPEVPSMTAERDRFTGGAMLRQPLRLRTGGSQLVHGDELTSETDLQSRVTDGLAGLDQRPDRLGGQRVEHGVPLDQREPADPARLTPCGVEPHPRQPT